MAERTKAAKGVRVRNTEVINCEHQEANEICLPNKSLQGLASSTGKSLGRGPKGTWPSSSALIPSCSPLIDLLQGLHLAEVSLGTWASVLVMQLLLLQLLHSSSASLASGSAKPPFPL